MPPTYFFSFLWRRHDSDVWQPVDAVAAEHPLDYIQRARDTSAGVSFRLLFFCEIPLDVYERHRSSTE